LLLKKAHVYDSFIFVATMGKNLENYHGALYFYHCLQKWSYLTNLRRPKASSTWHPPAAAAAPPPGRRPPAIGTYMYMHT